MGFVGHDNMLLHCMRINKNSYALLKLNVVYDINRLRYRLNIMHSITGSLGEGATQTRSSIL